MTDMTPVDTNTSASKIPLNSSFSTLQEPHDGAKVQEIQPSQTSREALPQASSDKVLAKEFSSDPSCLPELPTSNDKNNQNEM